MSKILVNLGIYGRNGGKTMRRLKREAKRQGLSGNLAAVMAIEEWLDKRERANVQKP